MGESTRSTSPPAKAMCASIFKPTGPRGKYKSIYSPASRDRNFLSYFFGEGRVLPKAKSASTTKIRGVVGGVSVVGGYGTRNWDSRNKP